MARFSLRDLFLAIVCIAIPLAAYRYLWQPPPDPNAQAYLATYLAILTMATLGSFFGQPPWRRVCQGYAAFAWLNFVFVMYAGFWLSEIYDALRVVQGSRLGFILGILCAVLAGWLLEEPPAKPS